MRFWLSPFRVCSLNASFFLPRSYSSKSHQSEYMLSGEELKKKPTDLALHCCPHSWFLSKHPVRQAQEKQAGQEKPLMFNIHLTHGRPREL